MSKAILIIGESGAGKTTSLRTLPPDETYYIDCDGKGLSWKGWRNQYNKEKGNYLRTDDADKVLTAFQVANSKDTLYKYIVVDTLNAIMEADERRRSKERTYDKWTDLAYSIFDIIKFASKLREDLTIICVGHSQTEYDESGYMFTRMKTNGKKLDKIGVEKYFTTVLLSKSTDNGFIFETKASHSTAKTPMGAFESDIIENDIMLVLKALEEY